MKRGYSGDFNSLLPPLDKKRKRQIEAEDILKGLWVLAALHTAVRQTLHPVSLQQHWQRDTSVCVCVCVAAQINCTNALLVRRQLVYFAAFWTDVLSTVRESVQLSEASLAAEEEDVLVFGTTSLETCSQRFRKTFIHQLVWHFS